MPAFLAGLFIGTLVRVALVAAATLLWRASLAFLAALPSTARRLSPLLGAAAFGGLAFLVAAFAIGSWTTPLSDWTVIIVAVTPTLMGAVAGFLAARRVVRWADRNHRTERPWIRRSARAIRFFAVAWPSPLLGAGLLHPGLTGGPEAFLTATDFALAAAATVAAAWCLWWRYLNVENARDALDNAHPHAD